MNFRLFHARELLGGGLAALIIVAGETARADPSPTPASTAASDISIEELVITARRREEKLQDTPITISAISGRVLQAERLDRVADYAAKIANFSAVQQNTRLGGAPLFLLSTVAIFTPHVLGAEKPGVIWLASWLTTFYLSWSAIMIPVTAWAGEITGQYHGRSKVQSPEDQAAIEQ
jgi:hypothetical protein